MLNKIDNNSHIGQWSWGVRQSLRCNCCGGSGDSGGACCTCYISSCAYTAMVTCCCYILRLKLHYDVMPYTSWSHANGLHDTVRGGRTFPAPLLRCCPRPLPPIIPKIQLNASISSTKYSCSPGNWLCNLWVCPLANTTEDVTDPWPRPRSLADPRFMIHTATRQLRAFSVQYVVDWYGSRAPPVTWCSFEFKWVLGATEPVMSSTSLLSVQSSG